MESRSSATKTVGWNSPQSHETLKVSVQEAKIQKPEASPKEFQYDHAKWYGAPKAVKAKANGRAKPPTARFGATAPAKPYQDELELATTGEQERSIRAKERYKWILMKYDMERDNRLAQAEQLFMQSQRLRPEERISQKQYQEMKIRIEWDVAWRVFDHVNENNDTNKHIDLNCLDINEAQNITKQCIIEVAQKMYP